MAVRNDHCSRIGGIVFQRDSFCTRSCRWIRWTKIRTVAATNRELVSRCAVIVFAEKSRPVFDNRRISPGERKERAAEHLPAESCYASRDGGLSRRANDPRAGTSDRQAANYPAVPIQAQPGCRPRAASPSDVYERSAYARSRAPRLHPTNLDTEGKAPPPGAPSETTFVFR